VELVFALISPIPPEDVGKIPVELVKRFVVLRQCFVLGICGIKRLGEIVQIPIFYCRVFFDDGRTRRAWALDFLLRLPRRGPLCVR
jgi:hypothetical protein